MSLGFVKFQVNVNKCLSLRSDQEETDTRIVLYLHHASQKGFTSAVVRSPDTDVLMIVMHHSDEIPIRIFLDTGTGKNRKVINVSELSQSYGAPYCTALLGLYVFTGEDATSAFKGKGKAGLLKKLQSHPKFQDAFRSEWNSWPLSIDLYFSVFSPLSFRFITKFL